MAYSVYTGFTSGLITDDESWFLHVMTRVAAGERLYREVFFGAMPLSAYLGSALVRLFGSEIFTVKLFMAACFAGNVLLSLNVLGQLGLGPWAKGLVVLALLAFIPAGLPGAGSPYTTLVYAFLLLLPYLSLVSVGAVEGTADADSDSAGLSLLIGALVGLMFCTKQNLGVFALAGVTSIEVMRRGAQRGMLWRQARPVLLILVGFAIVTAVLVLPVWLQGGLPKLLEYGFLNRAAYVGVAGISYASQLGALWSSMWDLTSWGNALLAYRQTQYLIPFISFGALFLGMATRDRKRRRTGIVILTFTAVAFAGMFPRIDLPHVMPALPIMLVGIAWGTSSIRVDTRRALGLVLRGALAFWLAAGVAATLARPVRWLASRSYEIARLPHFGGELLLKSEIERLGAQGRSLARNIPAGERLFFLTPSAAKLYLLSGIENPTPFDYPLVTAFGFRGQEEVIEQIEQQRIQWVCMRALGPHPLRADRLEDYVEQNMVLAEKGQLCDLYRSGP